MQDDWHISIEQRYLHNHAGAGAREKERELAAGRSTTRRWIDRVLDVDTEDRNWRRGAEGEERVAARLAHLDDRWAIVHDLTIGTRGANLDHLILGPAGVFALNTKHLTGKLTVYEHAVLQNGHKTSFVPASLREVRTVQQRLSKATGWSVHAWGVLVVMGCEVAVEKPLANLSIVTERRLPRWLAQLPAGVLSAAETLELERAARTPDTWLSGTVSSRPRAGPTTSPPPKVTISRWTRFGKDRLYANGVDRVRLGYLDVPTGEIVLEVSDGNGTIAAQLRACHRALGHRR